MWPLQAEVRMPAAGCWVMTPAGSGRAAASLLRTLVSAPEQRACVGLGHGGPVAQARRTGGANLVLGQDRMSLEHEEEHGIALSLPLCQSLTSQCGLCYRVSQFELSLLPAVSSAGSSHLSTGWTTTSAN